MASGGVGWKVEAQVKVEGRGSRVEGRGSRVEGRGSRVEGRRPRVEGRGSRVEGRGLRVEGRGSRSLALTLGQTLRSRRTCSKLRRRGDDHRDVHHDPRTDQACELEIMRVGMGDTRVERRRWWKQRRRRRRRRWCCLGRTHHHQHERDSIPFPHGYRNVLYALRVDSSNVACRHLMSGKQFSRRSRAVAPAACPRLPSPSALHRVAAYASTCPGAAGAACTRPMRVLEISKASAMAYRSSPPYMTS